MNVLTVSLADSAGRPLKSFSSTQGAVQLGRGSRTSQSVRDPSSGTFRIPGTKVMSQNHCTLSWSDDGLHAFLTDFGSTNGTFISRDHEELRLKSDVPYRLKEGDKVIFGKTMNGPPSAGGGSPSILYTPLSVTVSLCSTVEVPRAPSPFDYDYDSMPPSRQRLRAPDLSRTLTATGIIEVIELSEDEVDSDAEPSSTQAVTSSGEGRRSGYGLSEADLLESDDAGSPVSFRRQSVEVYEDVQPDDSTFRFGSPFELVEYEEDTVSSPRPLSPEPVPSPREVFVEAIEDDGPFEADGGSWILRDVVSGSTAVQSKPERTPPGRLPSPVSPEQLGALKSYQTISDEIDDEDQEASAAQRKPRSPCPEFDGWSFSPGSPLRDGNNEENDPVFEDLTIVGGYPPIDVETLSSHLPSPSSSIDSAPNGSRSTSPGLKSDPDLDNDTTYQVQEEDEDEVEVASSEVDAASDADEEMWIDEDLDIDVENDGMMDETDNAHYLGTEDQVDLNAIDELDTHSAPHDRLSVDLGNAPVDDPTDDAFDGNEAEQIAVEVKQLSKYEFEELMVEVEEAVSLGGLTELKTQPKPDSIPIEKLLATDAESAGEPDSLTERSPSKKRPIAALEDDEVAPLPDTVVVSNPQVILVDRPLAPLPKRFGLKSLTATGAAGFLAGVVVTIVGLGALESAFEL